MKYEVIRYFTDAQDKDYAYHEGDIYPRDGINPTEQRINDLLSGNNFQRVALIMPLKGNGRPKKPEFTEEEIRKMPPAKVKAVAKQHGIEVDGKKAPELKEELIKKFVEV